MFGCPFVLCNDFFGIDGDFATSQSPEYFVVELIKDFNQKHPGVNEIVIFSDDGSDLLRAITKKVSLSNPISMPGIHQCTKLGYREAAFVIFILKTKNSVSFKYLLRFRP